MPIETKQTPEYTSLLQTLITANHILHYHSLVDAFGHISLRHPHDPSVYVMPGYLAPALVRSPDDLIEYHISDSSPINPNAPKGYSERFIHGEIFKKYPGINCVIHSHSEAVIPFMIARVGLKPVFHMAGFLGVEVPVWDVTKEELYLSDSGHQKDMLVNNSALGSALASSFSKVSGGKAEGEGVVNVPEHTVVLMRHHGFTNVGENIRDAVYRAIYTQKNAQLMIDAAGLRIALKGPGEEADLDLDFLTEEEARGCRKMNENTADKAWRLWVKEVEGGGLYINDLAMGSK